EREYSLFDGLYWASVTMTTLGYGDIVFHEIPGKIFTIVVLGFGMFSMLVVLPFAFIKLFYEPWMGAETAALTPTELSPDVSGHVVLTQLDSVTSALLTRLKQYGLPYVYVTKDLEKATKAHESGIRVMVGDIDDPETFRKARIDKAALMAATGSDIANTNLIFNAREVSKDVPIVATADNRMSVDVMELAGASNVVELADMMGQWLARRMTGGDSVAHVIGEFDQLAIAEATVAGTPLVGKTIAECQLREKFGLLVVGMWERGKFQPALPESMISANTVLVFAATEEQLAFYDELFCIYNRTEAAVVVIGAGRVGRATGKALDERGIDYRIVESDSERIHDPEKYVLGNAAELEVLERAGIRNAPAVIITTHDDDTNIYLTIYCRRLRPDIQIISRCIYERSVANLHRAGADFVMSYASMGANIIFNLLKRSDILMLAEGLNVFRMSIPDRMKGKSLADSNVRAETGCNVIAIKRGDDVEVNPDPTEVLGEECEIIVIGSVEAEDRFLKGFTSNK
ncbi:NAD-binding protein, partial [bacterium]|nr:NAD-binding protein [bacterium]